MKRNYINTHRWLFALLLLCSAGVAMAQHQSTEDYVNISKVELEPGGSYQEITVSLSGNTYYSAYEMDIYIPDGFEFVENKNRLVVMSKPSLYPYTESEDDEGNPQKEYTHTIASALQNDGALRVSCTSSNNEYFISTSGNLFKFYVKASLYAKAGFADVKITGCHFIVSDNAVQYNAANQVISDKLSASEKRSLSFSITKQKKWSTRVFPFSVRVPEGMSVYTYSRQDNENVYLTKKDEIEAYVPYVIKINDEYQGDHINVDLEGTAIAKDYTDQVNDGICGKGILKGAVTNQSVDEGYVLQSQGGGECMFYPILDGDVFTIPSGKCWLTLPASGVKGLNFVISDEADAIQNIESRPSVSAVYDLQGRSVTATQHGVYIIDGKKVIK